MIINNPLERSSGRALVASLHNGGFEDLIEKGIILSQVERWLYLSQYAYSTNIIEVNDEMEYWLYLLRFGKNWDKKKAIP